jgi:hypothetical protein
LSLVGLASGLIVLAGLLTAKRMDGWTALYLVTMLATVVTGFGFPFSRFLPSHGVGIVTLAVLLAAVFARYSFHLAGAARWIYAIGAVLALYLDVFVALVQAFTKVPALRALAPTQTEPPFVITQLVAAALFLALAILAALKFRPAAAIRAPSIARS